MGASEQVCLRVISSVARDLKDALAFKYSASIALYGPDLLNLRTTCVDVLGYKAIL